MKQILIPVPSVTYAEKGLSVLTRGGYRARIVRPGGRMGRHGCVFALSLPDGYDTAVIASLLESSGVRFSEIRYWEGK